MRKSGYGQTALAVVVGLAIPALFVVPCCGNAHSIVSMQPTGPWVLDAESGECLLQRSYIAGKSPLIMALRPHPYRDGIDVLILERGDLPLGLTAGRLSLTPSGQDFDTNVAGDELLDGRVVDRFTEIGGGTPPDKMLSGVQAITVKVGHYSRSMATPEIDKALKALMSCDRILIRSWGFDPDERQRINIPAKPINEVKSWITSSDYPSRSLLAGIQGNTTVLYTIRIDGSADDCKPVVKSGSDVLDATACRSIERNARFKPAQDFTGSSMASHRVDTIYWRIGV